MIQAVILDFDGVIAESVNVKTKAFRKLFAGFPRKLPEIIRLHLKHGGLSRFVKFDMIYRDILRKPLILKERVRLGRAFAALVLKEVISCPLVKGADFFLKKYSLRFPLFIVSGTPDKEIKNIVKKRKLSGCFSGVFGSPIAKKELINRIIKKHGFTRKCVFFVGDSLDDKAAARAAGIKFVGRITAHNDFHRLNKTGRIRNLLDLDRLIDEK